MSDQFESEDLPEWLSGASDIMAYTWARSQAPISDEEEARRQGGFRPSSNSPTSPRGAESYSSTWTGVPSQAGSYAPVMVASPPSDTNYPISGPSGLSTPHHTSSQNILSRVSRADNTMALSDAIAPIRQLIVDQPLEQILVTLGNLTSNWRPGRLGVLVACLSERWMVGQAVYLFMGLAPADPAFLGNFVPETGFMSDGYAAGFARSCHPRRLGEVLNGVPENFQVGSRMGQSDGGILRLSVEMRDKMRALSEETAAAVAASASASTAASGSGFGTGIGAGNVLMPPSSPARAGQTAEADQFSAGRSPSWPSFPASSSMHVPHASTIRRPTNSMPAGYNTPSPQAPGHYQVSTSGGFAGGPMMGNYPLGGPSTTAHYTGTPPQLPYQSSDASPASAPTHFQYSGVPFPASNSSSSSSPTGGGETYETGMGLASEGHQPYDPSALPSYHPPQGYHSVQGEGGSRESPHYYRQ